MWYLWHMYNVCIVFCMCILVHLGLTTDRTCREVLPLYSRNRKQLSYPSGKDTCDILAGEVGTSPMRSETAIFLTYSTGHDVFIC